jgi:hypothetical protein
VRWLFGFEGVGGAFSEDDRLLLLLYSFVVAMCC